MTDPRSQSKYVGTVTFLITVVIVSPIYNKLSNNSNFVVIESKQIEETDVLNSNKDQETKL